MLPKNNSQCYHTRIRTMDWPDGSTSACCETCLFTQCIDELSETEWQDHNYKTIADWYDEAAKFQRSMDKIKLPEKL